MGMFDRVIADVTCSNCEGSCWHLGLQSKDGDCKLQDLTLEQLLEQSEMNHVFFYATCEDCGVWNEWRAERQPPILIERHIA